MAHSRHLRRWKGNQSMRRRSSAEQGDSDTCGCRRRSSTPNLGQLDKSGSLTRHASCASCSLSLERRSSSLSASSSTEVSDAEAGTQLCYHPTLSGRKGYFGSLSVRQTGSLEKLRVLVKAGKLRMSVLCGEGSHAEPLDLCMIRYLRANKWDEVKAKTQLEENIKWRTERDVRGLELSHPATVLGCTPQEMETLVAKHYPHWHLGADRLGRPVFLFRYGSFHTNELLKVTTLNNLVDYHIWEMEHHHKLLGKYSEDAGHIVDTCTLILDFGGMELGQVTGDFIKILRQMAETDGKHYPGRAGSTFVINAPPLFHMIWGTIKGFMERDGVVVEVYGNPGQWRDKLAKQIDPRELPPYLGGTGRALQDTPFMCRYYHPTGWGGEADAAAAAEEEEGDETDSPRRLPSPNFMEAALSKFDAFTSKEFASLAEVRRIAANKLGGRGEKFVKLFFPDAGISPNAQLTEGSSSRGLERKASLSDKIESLFFPPSPS